jgi:hypothetical protein
MSDFAEPERDIFENLPEDPEEAFLLLEEKFRNECESAIAASHQDESVNVYYVDYIAQVIAAISELGLQAQFDDRIPQIEDVNYQTYINFSKDVKHYRTMLLIRRGKRTQGYSVRFDTATRSKVQHHIEQLRTIFDKLEIELDRREALFDKLNGLQKEVDRDRTRFDVYAALAVEAAGVVGDSVDKSKILEVLNAIARVMWGTKKDQDTKRLPPPNPPKRLEAPRRPQIPRSPKGRNEDDEEIPF